MADLKADSSNIVNFYDFAVFVSTWLDVSCSQSNDWCDGADFDQDGFVGFEDLYFISTCWLETPCRIADLKIDISNTINFNDLAVFVSAWLNEMCSQTNSWCEGADFDRGGFVGLEDLDFISSCWLKTFSPDTTAPTPAPVFIISPDINYVSSEDHNTSGQFRFMDYPVDNRWWHKIVVDTSGIADNITPTEDLEVRFICLSKSSFSSTNRVPIPLTLGLADGVLGSRANRWRVTIIGDKIIYDVDVDTYAALGRTLNWKVCVYDAAGNSICTAMHTLGPPGI
jgi:hypothetical protein